MLVTNIFSFSQNVFKRPIQEGRKKSGSCGRVKSRDCVVKNESKDGANYNRKKLILSNISVNGVGTLNDSIIDHPLALSDQSPLESPKVEDYISDYRGSTNSLYSLGSNLSKSSSFQSERSKITGHGLCLTASDQDRLRIFIHEFVVRALIPWAERQLRTLNELVIYQINWF